MNKTLFLLFFILIGGLSKAQEIPNGGFESWSGTPEEPASWGTLSFSIPLLGDFASASKSTDSHTGDFALALESINIPLINLAIPGAAATGTLNQLTFQSSGGFPFTLRPNAIKGYYKYQPVGADTASVEAILTRWNTDLGKRDTVGYGKKIFRDAIGSYKLFSVPLVLDATASPDTARITVYSSSQSNPTAGSKLFLDDLEFFTTTAGIEEQAASAISVYPNPAANLLHVVGDELTTLHSIRITNLLGQCVLKTTANTGDCVCDIHRLPDGLYFCHVINPQGLVQKSLKFIIKN